NLAANRSFTMEGWVSVESFPTTGTSNLWNITSSTNGSSIFRLGYDAEGYITVAFNSQSQNGGTRIWNTGDEGGSGAKLTLGNWTHLAYVKTEMEIELYVNGVLVQSFMEAGITSRNAPTSLGQVVIAQNIQGKF